MNKNNVIFLSLILVLIPHHIFASRFEIYNTTEGFGMGNMQNTVVSSTGNYVTVSLVNEWISGNIYNTPYARRYSQIIYDELTKTMLVYGGSNNTDEVYGDMWEYNPAIDRWELIKPVTSPGKRYGHSMCYLGNGKIFVFGGKNDSNEVYGDTWLYDRNTDIWTMIITTGTVPGKRFMMSAVSTDSNTVILFGGISEGQYKRDTWLFDYRTGKWEEIVMSVSPSARMNAMLCYSKDDNKCVLFGGYNTSKELNDTWTFDLPTKQWLSVQTKTAPVACSDAVMVYDRYLSRAVFFGGSKRIGLSNDTWLYNLKKNEWSYSYTKKMPEARFGHCGCYDSNRKSVVVFGGSGSEYHSDIWSYHFAVKGEYTTPLLYINKSTELIWESVTVKPPSDAVNNNIGYRVSTSTNGVFWTGFLDRNGNELDYYNGTGIPVSLGMGTKNYTHLKLKFYLTSVDPPHSPEITEVRIVYNCAPEKTNTLLPKDGFRTNTEYIEFTFSNSSDDDNDELLYDFEVDISTLYRSKYKVSLSSITEGAGFSRYTLTQVLNPGVWYWHVRARDTSDLPGEWSNNSAVIIDRIAPAEVTGFTGISGPGHGNITLTWVSPGDDGTMETGVGAVYEIAASSYTIFPFNQVWNRDVTYKDSWFTILNPSERNNYLFSNLNDDTTYYVYLRSCDTAGNYSTTSRALYGIKTPAVPVVEILTPNADAELKGDITINWHFSDPDVEDTYLTSVYISTNNGYNFSILVTSGIFTYDAQATWNTNHIANNYASMIRVEIRDSYGMTGIAQSTAVFKVYNPNYAPVLEVVSPSSGTNIVSRNWTLRWAVKDNNYADDHFIDIYYTISPDGEWLNLTTETLVNTTYYLWNTYEYNNGLFYKLKFVVHDSGYPVNSDTKITRIFTVNNNNVPPEEFNLNYPYENAYVNASTKKFVWESSSDNNQEDKVNYTLQYSTTMDFSKVTEIAGLTTNFYIPDVSFLDDTTYYWRVSAWDSMNSYTSSIQEYIKFYSYRYRVSSTDGMFEATALTRLPEGVYLSISVIQNKNNAQTQEAGKYTNQDPMTKEYSSLSYRLYLSDAAGQEVYTNESIRLRIKTKYLVEQQGVKPQYLRLCKLTQNEKLNAVWRRASGVQLVDSQSQALSLDNTEGLGTYCVLQYAPEYHLLNGLTAYPNPFTPDSQKLNIRYILTRSAKVSVYLYNTVGDLVYVREIPAGSFGAEGTEEGMVNEIEWDGYNGRQKVVASGAYFLKISANVPNTNEGKSLITTIAVLR
ncbi:MAG: kelch repeat-containing protein [Elusimicrobiota bacterium]